MQPPSKISKWHWQSRNLILRSAHTKKKSVPILIGQCVSYATTARGDSVHSLTFVYFYYYSPRKITILPSSFPFTWPSVMDPTCQPNQTSITRCGTRFLLVSVIHVSPAPPQNQITKTPLLRFLSSSYYSHQPPFLPHSNEGDLCNFKPRNDKKVLN